MSEELTEIKILLRKCLPIIRENPKIMTGCDVSDEEITQIVQTKQLSLEILEHLAGDSFFETYNGELQLTDEQAIEVANFLKSSAKYFIDKLKLDFPFLSE